MKAPRSLLCLYTLLLSFSDAKSSIRRNGQTRGHLRSSLAEEHRDLQAKKGKGDDPNVGSEGTTAPEYGLPDGGTPDLYLLVAPSTAPNEDGGQPDSSGPGSSQNPVNPTSGPTFVPSSPSRPPATYPPTEQQTPPPQPVPTLAASISAPSPRLPDASNPMVDPHSHQMDPGCAATAQGIDDVTNKSIRVTYLYELVTQADSLWYSVANFLETTIQGFLATSLVTCDGTSTPVGDVRGVSASGLNQVTGDACTSMTSYDPVLLSCHVMNGTMVVHSSPASTMMEEEIRKKVWDTLRADFNNRRRRLGSSLLNSDAGIIGLYFLSQGDPTVGPSNSGNVQGSNMQSTESGSGLGLAISAGLVGAAIFLLAIIGFVYAKQRGTERSKTGRSLWASEREDDSATLEEDVIPEPSALNSGFDDGSSTEDSFGHEQSWSADDECQVYNYLSTSMSPSRLGTGRDAYFLSRYTTASTVAERCERGATIKPVSNRDDSPTRIYPVAEGDTVDF